MARHAPEARAQHSPLAVGASYAAPAVPAAGIAPCPERPIASFDRWYETLETGSGRVYRHTLAVARGADAPLAQQGFSTTEDIVALGRAVRAGPGRPLLDVCCGPGGPSVLLAARLGCAVTGLDRSPAALRLAVARGGPRVRYVAGDALHQPFAAATFPAAMVIDSLAAIPDKAALLRELARVLIPGGRFGCTVEAGEPLGPADLAPMAPGAEADVRPLAAFLGLLRAAGFRPLALEDRTAKQARVARRLAAALSRNRIALTQELSGPAVDGLVATIGTWAGLLARGRVAMLGIVAERVA
jgi:SAM-dependent methyltransferase